MSDRAAKRDIQTIVVGGSAGALDALGTILPALPAAFPIPVLIVLHITPTRPSHLAEVIALHCRLAVKEADDKEPVAPGNVYVAPPNYHLLVEKGGALSLSVDDPVHFSRPSIDVLFESAADAYGPRVCGVLLTGANADGAQGLARIKRGGGLTIVQSPDTAAVNTMPNAAIRLVSPDLVLPLSEIGAALARLAPAAMAAPGAESS